MWLCYKFLCSIFSKDTQSFDFIKLNVVRKLAYKVKYSINVGMIMFFENFRKRFLLISWLDCEQYRKNQYKKQERNQYISVFKELQYLVMKRPMITENTVVKIQNLIVNHESQPVKSNPDSIIKILIISTVPELYSKTYSNW